MRLKIADRRIKIGFLFSDRWKEFTLLLISTIFLSIGCTSSSLLRTMVTGTMIPTGTKVVLPATWTDLPQEDTGTPSITPSPTTSPTITPTHTSTSTHTPVFSPTVIGSSRPSATPDWSAVQLPDCTFTASSLGVRLFTAPFVDPYHVLPTMEPGKSYPAVLTKPTYTLLLENGEALGWIDYRWVTVSHSGADCLNRQDQREITDFPSLCFFTPLREIGGYADGEFKEQQFSLAPPASLVVLYQRSNGYFTAYGSSGPSFFVKSDEVSTHGNCSSIPTLAEAVVETSIFTLPPDQGGSIVYTLSAGESVFSQSKIKQGAPPAGAIGPGHWILVRRHSWAEDINGWMWSEHLKYK